MIKKILFATDLGAFTSHAILHVEQLARQFDARVSVVHAVPPLGEFATAVVKSHCSAGTKRELLDQPRLQEMLDGIRDEIFERLMSSDFGELDLARRVDRVVVAPGNPAGVVLDYADSLKVDMIVVGSHSPEALDGRLLGSVAGKILQLAKVPVLMVPMAKNPFGHGQVGADNIPTSGPEAFGT